MFNFQDIYHIGIRVPDLEAGIAGTEVELLLIARPVGDVGLPVAAEDAAVGVDDGAAAEAVRMLKYGRSTAVVSALADSLASAAPPVDLVTWCPASRGRRRERGFDQSELLARAVAHRIGAPRMPSGGSSRLSR